MSNLKVDLDTPRPDIFAHMQQIAERQLPTAQVGSVSPGSLNIDAILREMINHSLKRSKLDRYRVAADMSRLIGKDISKAMLDAFSSESKEGHRFPAAYLAAFVVVTGDVSILAMLCQKVGGFFVPGENVLALQLARLQEEKLELDCREKMIRNLLESVKAEAEHE